MQWRDGLAQAPRAMRRGTGAFGAAGAAVTERVARGRWAAALAATAVAFVLTGCGSRVPHAAIVVAGRSLVSSGSAASGNGSAQAALGASSTTGTATTVPAGTGGAAVTSAGATGGAAASTPGGAGTAAHGSTPVTKTTTAAPASVSTINLGNVGTYSGLVGAIFSGAQQSLEVWQAYINAHGGLNGHPVHVYSEDDGGDPATNQTEVQQEVTQDHVIAFVGNLEPLTASAALPYLQQQNIPVIGGDASSLTWWQSPIMFPQASFLNREGDATIDAGVAAGKTKLAYLYCIEDTTCTNGYQIEIVNGGAKADGADPVYSASYSLTQPDFTTQCLSAQQAGANVVFFAGDGDSLVRMARDCSAQNYDPLYLAASIAVNAAVQSDPLLNGLISTQSNFPWVDSYTAAQATYQQAMKTYAPNVAGSGSTAAEWASGMLAVAADQDLGATPTSAQFLQGLWSIKNNNLGGLAPPLTFNQGADASQSNCFFKMILHNGQFVDPNNGNYQCL
jgi:branched-chain amino acid transport system substrate-binding protein